MAGTDASGIAWINERDVYTDFSLVVTDITGFPGMLSGAPRDVPLAEAPELSGGVADPKLVRRKRLTPPSIKGYLDTASVAAAVAALDNLRALLGEGEVRVRTTFASDRYCLGFCEATDGLPWKPQRLSGNPQLSLLFTIAEGVAIRMNADGYALSSARTSCPNGTAATWPVFLLSTGGSATPVVNPVITIRNAGGDPVQTMGFTGSIAQNDFWRVDCARAAIDKSVAGVITDGGGLWTSGDFPVLRPADAWFDAAAWATAELSATSGTPVGEISYVRRYL